MAGEAKYTPDKAAARTAERHFKEFQASQDKRSGLDKLRDMQRKPNPVPSKNSPALDVDNLREAMRSVKPSWKEPKPAPLPRQPIPPVMPKVWPLGPVPGDGKQGDPGQPGINGTTPDDPNFTVEINMIAHDDEASVDIDGTYPDLTITFNIPTPLDGEDGVTPVFASVVVNMHDPGYTATGTITGPITALVLTLELPRGDKGDKGDKGDPGDATTYTPANPGDWNNPAPNTVGAALDRLAAANPGA